MTAHGGDVWQVAEEFGAPASDLLDFSSNINPRGLPAGAAARLARGAADSVLLSRYPDPSARRLRQALAERLRIDMDAIVVGPGAESLLGPILQCARARKVLVPTPAFSEYRRVCAQQAVEVEPFPLDRSEYFQIPLDRFCNTIHRGHFDAVFVNNPHNPSGAHLPVTEMKRIADAVRDSGATLILDEAFIDYSPNDSLTAAAASQGGLVVLRSLTKIYGCPALRVGFAVAKAPMAHDVRELLPTWPVTQLAADALTAAVWDDDYLFHSICENRERRGSLAVMLDRLGVGVCPSVANYLLLELPETAPVAAELRRLLIQNHRILIRNCDSYEGLPRGRYVRVAVRSEKDNLRLVDALRQELR